MTEISIHIKDCRECPHFEINGSYSTDGFDHGDDWYCKREQRQIAKFVEWTDKMEVPNWCPIKVNDFVAHIGVASDLSIHLRNYSSLVCSQCTDGINFKITKGEFDKLKRRLHTKIDTNE